MHVRRRVRHVAPLRVARKVERALARLEAAFKRGRVAREVDPDVRGLHDEGHGAFGDPCVRERDAAVEERLEQRARERHVGVEPALDLFARTDQGVDDRQVAAVEEDAAV